jgi:hypothetical protein
LGEVQERSSLGQKTKNQAMGGSVLANKTWVGSFEGKWDPIGAGYTGIEVVRGHDWVRCERGLGQKTKS